MDSSTTMVVLDMRSQVTPWKAPRATTCPTAVTINGTAVTPVIPPNGPGQSGFVLLAFDATSPLTPTTPPRISGYYPVEPDEDGMWSDTYLMMYEKLWFDLTTQTNPNSTLVMLASFNLDWGMVPSVEIIQYLFTLGAGQKLQHWAATANAGTQGTNWVSQPTNYGLVGYSGSGFANFLGEEYGEGAPVASTSCPVPILSTSTGQQG